MKLLVVGRLWLDARCPPKAVYHNYPQLDREEKIDVKAYELRQGEITHQLLLQVKQT